MAFVPLFCESHYGIHGVGSPAEWVERARSLGYRSVGLCDENSTAGFHEFDEACRASEMQPVFGCRLRVDGLVLTDRAFPLDFLIESEAGYRNLARILTQYHDLRDRETNIPRRLGLKGRTNGLTVVLPPDGELSALVALRDRPRTERFLATAIEYFGRNVLVGVDPDLDPKSARSRAKAEADEPDDDRPASAAPIDVSPPAQPIVPQSPFKFVPPPPAERESSLAEAFAPAAAGPGGSEHEAAALVVPETERAVRHAKARPSIVVTLRALAEFVGLDCVAASRMYFPRAEDAPVFVRLTCPKAPPSRWWRAPRDERILPTLREEEDFEKRYSLDEDAFHESGELARRCNWRPAPNRRVVPVPDFERGVDPNSYLFNLVIQGAARRYGEIGEEARDRINREFEEVKSRNLAPYFLLCRRIADRLDERRIARGVGRGPAVASLIAYSLGLTQVDPLKYHLAVRPMTAEGETFPPIPVETSSKAVPEIVEWLRAEFGDTHVAAVGYRPPADRERVVEDLAEWAGAGDEDLRAAMRRDPGIAETIRRERSEISDRLAWSDPGLMRAMADRLAERPAPLEPARGLWTLGADPLDSVAPTLRLPDGLRVTEIAAAAVDRLGGPRVEFVSHHAMNVLERASAGVPGVDLSNIPQEDRATLDLLSRGDVLGIPPLERVTTQCLLRKQRPANLLQLFRVLADSRKGRSDAAGRELYDDLPDALMGWRLAWLKANFPTAFFAAALTSEKEEGRPLEGVARAARRAGIDLVRPDIHLSPPDCQAFAGKIRLGLRMVRHMTDAALAQIVSVRQGGDFNSIEEFCTRVDSPLIPPRLLQSLVASGALDGLGEERGAMWARVETIARRRRLQADPSAGAADPIPEPDLAAVAWDPATRVRRQREALGFSLEGDSFAPFARTLAALSPASAENGLARLNGKSVRMIGFVDHFDADGPVAGAEGGRIASLEGVPVWLSAGVARLSGGALRTGEPVVAFGKVHNREGYLRLDADGLWRLTDLDLQSARVSGVRLRLADENAETLGLVLAVAKQFPGESRLEPEGYPGRRGFAYRRLLGRRVFFCAPLYQALCKILSPDRVEALDENGRRLDVSPARLLSGGL